jgi:hypothetical protein
MRGASEVGDGAADDGPADRASPAHHTPPPPSCKGRRPVTAPYNLWSTCAP